MGIFSLNSDNLFLRSAGKNRVMVVKLTKDVHSSVVNTKDWVDVDIIGSNMSYDVMKIFSKKLRGKKLRTLATYLSESRLWVNREGTSFIRLCINSLSSHVVFYKNNDLFNWDQFGVNKLIVNNDDDDEDDKSLEDLKKELNEYKNKLKIKEDEIKKLKEKTPENKQDQANKDDNNDAEIKKLQGKLDKSIEDYNKVEKDLEAKKHKIAQLEEDIKKNGKEIANLNDKINEAKDVKHELEAKKHKITQLEEDIKKNGKEIANLNEKLKDAKDAKHELEAKKHKITQLEEDIKKNGKEITTLNNKLEEAKDENHVLDQKITKLKEELRTVREEDKKLSSPSSSSSSVITQYDQILHKWRRPVLAIRFNTVNWSSYSPDFSTMPTYRAVDEYVQGRYPSNINVYLSNGSFDKNNWWFIKRRDESSGNQSLFAFYGGIYDSIATYSRGSYQVKIPYASSATFRGNYRFQAVALRGYGAVFGFCYN